MLAVVLLWAVVLPAIDDAIPYDSDIGPGTVFEIGQGVRFTPDPSWGLDSFVPGLAGETEIHKRAVTFTIRVGAFNGTAADLMDSFEDQVDDAWPLGDRASVTTAQGVTGVGEVFDGPGTEGQLVTFVEDGVGVEIRIEGPDGSTSSLRAETNAMIESVQFAGTGGEGE